MGVERLKTFQDIRDARSPAYVFVLGCPFVGIILSKGLTNCAYPSKAEMGRGRFEVHLGAACSMFDDARWRSDNKWLQVAIVSLVKLEQVT